MKTLTNQELQALAGQYFSPPGLYHRIKSLPFLGSLHCSTSNLTAGQHTELLITYTVGGSGLADGSRLKCTFKFYSDWALFQTSSPTEENYVSAEYTPGPLLPGQEPATVQGLAVKFDQKGHERPFQKAVVVDVVDGYLNPGDRIVVRLGDRRWGARGTRCQTSVEKEFCMRWYVDPVGTSRFAEVKPDVRIGIVPGAVRKGRVVTPRVVKPGVEFKVRLRTEDHCGNTTADLEGVVARLEIVKEGVGTTCWEKELEFPSEGWSVSSASLSLPDDGDYILTYNITDSKTSSHLTSGTDYISVSSSFPVPRALFADLHVHSDDTVGTNSTTYNFSYGHQIAGLDIIGYTANDFNITESKWNATLDIISRANIRDELLIFPGTEWCGNSSAGGDHNVVFLDDPAISTPEFPFDRHGNVARSFEWNEHGPAELLPGAWPLDEVYATYAHAPEKHLLIPHVGGRRCNLAWHYPVLERLLEIGSAWGLFEWLLRDAVRRGWKLGVCANSDEHRGRCGGGVPGTAVFGVKGGLTGVLAERVERGVVAEALRARRTFATTGERLVGLVRAEDGTVQGEELTVEVGKSVSLAYEFYGSEGFSTIEAWDGSGEIFSRNLQREASQAATPSTRSKLRIKWGGARLFDRYREAVWKGSILVSDAAIDSIHVFGGVSDNPEDRITHISATQITFNTRTSGDFDGVDVYFEGDNLPSSVSVTGQLGGYVKVGDALAGNPHKAQPEFSLVADGAEIGGESGASISIAGGVDLFVSAELLLDVPLPRSVQGKLVLPPSNQKGREQAVYFVGREYSGGKVITSPMFLTYM